jgi:hypothetical protein
MSGNRNRSSTVAVRWYKMDVDEDECASNGTRDRDDCVSSFYSKVSPAIKPYSEQAFPHHDAGEN